MLANPFRTISPDHHTSLFALYITEALRNFGLALVGIFIPIYIFQLTGNFYFLPLYVFITSLSIVLGTLMLGNFLAKVGIAKSVALSNFLRLLLLLSLLGSSLFPPLIFLAAIFEGLLIPTYWIPYHFIFVREGKTGFYGRQIGLMGIFAKGLSALGPLLGGLVITVFGFPALYLLGMGVVLFSSLPLSLVGDHLSFPPFLRAKIIKGLFSPSWRMPLLGYASFKIEALAGGIFWPLFLFGIAGSFTNLGALASLPAALGIISLLFVTSLIDKMGYRKSLTLGAFLWAVSWLVAGFLGSLPALFLLLLFQGVVGPLFSVSPDALTYTLARGEPFPFIVKRELAIHGSGLIVAPLVAGLWYFFPEKWPVLFLMGALGALGAIFLTRAKS